MEVLTKEEVELRKHELAERILKGAIFIHPTDTIYGLGCNALLPEAVKKIRELKNAHEQPFSVIAPSKTWIELNCIISEKAAKWLERLPGPYTLILPLKNEKAIAREVNNGIGTLGVRIPKHWISEFVSFLGFPVITTSVNKAGSAFMTSLENLDHDIKAHVDFIIYDGELFGKPSTIVHLEETRKLLRVIPLPPKKIKRKKSKKKAKKK